MPRLTFAKSWPKILLKPRFGMRMWSGSWPPSKPLIETPERLFWPFWPRPAVLPLPKPMPRPTRIRPLRAPLLSRRSLSLIVMVALAFAVFALWTGPEGSVRFDFARWLKARIGSGLFHHDGLGDIAAAIDLGDRRAAVRRDLRRGRGRLPFGQRC